MADSDFAVMEAINTITPRLNDLMRAIEDTAMDYDEKDAIRVQFAMPGCGVVIESTTFTTKGHYNWSTTIIAVEEVD